MPPVSADIGAYLSRFAPSVEIALPQRLLTARSEAEARLGELGLPRRQDEYWKYTDPQIFLRPWEVNPPEPRSVPALLEDACLVVHEGGNFHWPQKELYDSQSVRMFNLVDAMNSASRETIDLFGRLEGEAHAVIPRPLAAANTCIASRGLVIECPADGQAALQIVHRPNQVSGGSVLHHVIDVCPNSHLRIVESGIDSSWSNIVFEIRVRKGATFDLVRAIDGTGGAALKGVCSVFAEVEEDGCFNLFNLSLNTPWIRNESIVKLSGDRSQTSLAGAVVGGSGTHHDDTVLIVHEGLACQSRQVFKKVLRHGAQAVFQGKILVRPGAQKTDGYQLSQGLLLDGNSQFLAKPELEIYADDVACSHGSTSGGVDAAAMFYLRSRGIGKAEAEKILALAFVAEAIEEVADAYLVEKLTDLAACGFAEAV